GRLARCDLAAGRARGLARPGGGAFGGGRGAPLGGRRPGTAAARDLTRLLRQAVDSFQDVVDVGARARPLDLDLQRLDRGARVLVSVLQPAVDLPAQVRRDAALGLTKRAASRADRTPNEP